MIKSMKSSLYNNATFENIQLRDKIYLYAGDLEFYNRTPLSKRFMITKKNGLV